MKSFFLKIVFSSLVSVYVFTTVGVNIIAHYCGGELEKVSLFKPASCCEGEDAEEDDCCANDSKYVSFQSDFTFCKLVNTCKASVKNLFVTFSSSANFDLENNYHCLLVFDTNIHPPNLVQHNIVSSSVIRI